MTSLKAIYEQRSNLNMLVNIRHCPTPTFDDFRVFVGVVELLHVADLDDALLVEVHLAESLQTRR